MPALKYRTTLPRPDDPDIYEPICDALAHGQAQTTAAANAGIHEDTLYHWRYQGQEELAALEGQWRPWGELGSHAQLVIRLKEAEAQFVGTALQNWWDAEQNWAKWPTMLERRRPGEFGRQQRVEVRSQSVSITIDVAQLPERVQRELLSRAVAALQQKQLEAPKDG